MKTLLTSLVLLVITSAVQAQFPTAVNAAKSAVNGGQLLSQFTNALKPTSFTSGWTDAKDGIMGKAQKATKAIEIASTVSTVLGYIKPDMFKQGSTAAGLISTANKVKTMGEASGLLKSVEGSLKPEAFTSNWSTNRPAWLAALNQLK